MTKIIKNWRQKLADYIRKSEKEAVIKDKRVLILNLLQNSLTTEESINLYNDISKMFISKMKTNLENVSHEKDVLSGFLFL